MKIHVLKSIRSLFFANSGGDDERYFKVYDKDNPDINDYIKK